MAGTLTPIAVARKPEPAQHPTLQKTSIPAMLA